MTEYEEMREIRTESTLLRDGKILEMRVDKVICPNGRKADQVLQRGYPYREYSAVFEKDMDEEGKRPASNPSFQVEGRLG